MNSMKNIVLKCAALFLFIIVLGRAAAPVYALEPAAPQVTVSVDPRVELMAIIFRLAGNKEYNDSYIPSYARDVDEHFAPFKDHPVVKLAAELKKTRGIGYDGPMTLAIHITDTVSLGERVPFSPQPEALDSRWTPAKAREFLALARDFVKLTGFNDFYARHQPLYDIAVQRMQAVLDKNAHLEWFDSFFGPRTETHFRLVLGMVNGGNSYGPKIALPDGREEMYSVLGVWRIDAQGQPEFDPGVVSTVAHEFTHSYANPMVDRFAKGLRASGEKLYGLVPQEMAAQAYSNWKTLMCESLVRACVLRYQLDNYGPEAMNKAANYENSRSFYWVSGLADLLGKYEAKPRAYKGLPEFFPQIINYFNDYAKTAGATRGAIKAKARADQEKRKKDILSWRETGPKIVAMAPADGARDVPPDLKAIVITFDRPMSQSWSVVDLSSGHYPKTTGAAGYDAAQKVFTLPVELLPGKDYVLGLNSEDYNNFKSTGNIPLFPVIYKFKTK